MKENNKIVQFIDKSAVVAEIERIRREECPTDTYEGRCKMLWFEQFSSFLDTLEVKEVDLENYVHGTIDYPIIGSDFPNIYPNYKELKNYCSRKSIKDGDRVRLIIIKEK